MPWHFLSVLVWNFEQFADLLLEVDALWVKDIHVIGNLSYYQVLLCRSL